MKALRSMVPALVVCAAARGQPFLYSPDGGDSFPRPIWEDVGLRTGHGYGTRGGGYLATLGDLNRDGYDDFLCLGGDHNDPWLRTQVLFVSGRAGGLLRRRPLGDPQRPIWAIGAGGDMDGDGVPDYAVTIANPYADSNVVEACSGSDDRVLWRVMGSWVELFGYSLLCNVDLNGDGRSDLVLDTPRAGVERLGAVDAYDHRGTLLWRVPGTRDLAFTAESLHNHFGRVGDVNRDGLDDVAIGALYRSGTSYDAGPAILSGRDGTVLTVGQQPGQWLGLLNAGAGDVDGDGVPDVATVDGGAVAAVFSGRTGATIWLWAPTTPESIESVAGGVDLDRDGVPDIVVGSGGQVVQNINGKMFGFSGRDGTLLFELRNTSHYRSRFGQHFTIVCRPGEAFPTFIEGDPEFGVYSGPYGHIYLGRLRAFRGAIPGAEVFAPGCAGAAASAPRIGIRGFVVPGRGRRIHLSNAPHGKPAILLLGLSRTTWQGYPLPLRLDPIGLPGCSLATSVDFVGCATTGSRGLDAGYAYVDLPRFAPTSPVELHAQWLVLDSQGGRVGILSDALRWPVEP